MGIGGRIHSKGGRFSIPDSEGSKFSSVLLSGDEIVSSSLSVVESSPMDEVGPFSIIYPCITGYVGRII